MPVNRHHRMVFQRFLIKGRVNLKDKILYHPSGEEAGSHGQRREDRECCFLSVR